MRNFNKTVTFQLQNAIEEIRNSSPWRCGLEIAFENSRATDLIIFQIKSNLRLGEV